MLKGVWILIAKSFIVEIQIAEIRWTDYQRHLFPLVSIRIKEATTSLLGCYFRCLFICIKKGMRKMTAERCLVIFISIISISAIFLSDIVNFGAKVHNRKMLVALFAMQIQMGRWHIIRRTMHFSINSFCSSKI
jgi:hypothetical protein